MLRSLVLHVLLLAHALALRFELNDRVECHLGNDRWEPGTVIKLFAQQEENKVVPYVVQLDSGSAVVAPQDDDRFIRRQTTGVSSRLLRFSVGNRVDANLGDRWAPGTITAVNYRDPGDPDAVPRPYQIQLDSGGAVYAPLDSDSVVRREGSIRTRDPNLRFGVGDRVECFHGNNDGSGGRWEPGVVVALHYHEPRFGQGNNMPYQVKLDSGNLIFTPKDNESVIRKASSRAAAAAGGAAGQQAQQQQAQQPARAASGRGASKINQGRVGRRASTIGMKHSGSKLGGSKLGGGAAKARAHKSALPESREDARARLDRWRAASETRGL